MNIYVVPEIDIERFKETGVFAVRLLNNEAIHKSCEFCRWHLRDTTCFNDLEKRPRTTPEDSCWNWEERE